MGGDHRGKQLALECNRLLDPHLAGLEAVGEDELRAHYEANRQRFQTPLLYHLRLFTASPDKERGKSLLPAGVTLWNPPGGGG